MTTSTIIAESDEGDFHDLRSLRTGEPRATEGNLVRMIEYSIIWKLEPYMLDACLGK